MKLHTAEFKYTEEWKAKHDKQRKKAVVIAVAIPSHSYRKQQEEGTQETQEIARPGKYIPSFVCNDASNDKIPASFTNITDIACTCMHLHAQADQNYTEKWHESWNDHFKDVSSSHLAPHTVWKLYIC